MHLDIRVEDQDFNLSIGSGYNDWTWLSHFAARKFSKISYPQGTYLPSQLYLLDKDNQKIYPHPHQKINLFFEENKLSPTNVIAIVKIRKTNHVPTTKFERVWQNEAYGSERLMMNVVYLVDTEKYKNKEGEKQFYFKVLFHYNLHHDIKHMFPQKKYASPIEIELIEERIDNKCSSFKGSIKLPFGDVTPELYYYWRDHNDPTNFRHEKIKDSQLKSDSFRVSFIITPKYISIQEINQKVAEEMKITQNIAKSLQQKQLQAKKRNPNSSLCCYNFQQFWNLLQEFHKNELLLQNYDKSTKQRLKVIFQKSLNSLYEIFFYYFIIQNQNKQKKEELGITYQHAMHFLRFYRIFSEPQGLNSFLQYYNNDFKFKNIRDTVDIQNKPVKFVQFIAILIRAIQFVQTSTFMVKGETFDVSVAKTIDQIIQIDSEEEEFGQFKRNIRQNPKIISFIRNNASALKQIFVNQVIRSTQKAGDKYVMMKQQFKSLLQLSGLTNKNTDAIVRDLFEELHLSEEGIFYYQFIQAIQWLALALVTSDQNNNNIENEEEESILIIEKMKFFMDKVQL